MDLLQIIIHNFFSFIVIISFIVFIHEFGHYWVAKKCGVKIDAFSIGFGPEIFGWNDKSGTRWKISAVPLGGYVKMHGDENAASVPDQAKLNAMSVEEKSGSLHAQNVWKRMAIVGAGPAANFILAIVILTGFFMAYGRMQTSAIVGNVMEDSPAQEAGLIAGDSILSIRGEKISRFEDIVSIVSLNADVPLEVVIDRDGVQQTLSVTPRATEVENVFGESDKRGLIGISPAVRGDHQTLSFVPAVGHAVAETWHMSIRTLEALWQMVTGQRPADQLSGILRIGDYSGKAVDMGTQMVLWFMAVLSINLGLINLFPIPMLDGGHLAIYTVEALRGRPLPEKVQEYCFRFGFAVLIGLMLFATFNDLKHFGVF